MSANHRIQWLHKRIADMRYPNANRLAERFGISHRQAQRDVDSLRTEYGAPLKYSAQHRGFYYEKEFSLPLYTVCANEEDYVDTITGADNSHLADCEIVQMQIPYSAVVRIPDKLTQLELQQFIIGEEAKGDYICEFHNVEMFLGVLFSTEADLTVIKPNWLRERLLKCADRVKRNNEHIDEEEKK